jgi:hypothetical protein
LILNGAYDWFQIENIVSADILAAGFVSSGTGGNA